MRTTPKAQKSRPITITIEGELTDKIREHARAIGCRPATTVRQFVGWGHSMIDPSPEGEEFRRGLTTPTAVGTTLVSMPTAEIKLIEKFTRPAGVEAGEFLAAMFEDTVEQTTAGTFDELAGIPEMILSIWDFENKAEIETEFKRIRDRIRATATA